MPGTLSKVPMIERQVERINQTVELNIPPYLSKLPTLFFIYGSYLFNGWVKCSFSNYEDIDTFPLILIIHLSSYINYSFRCYTIPYAHNIPYFEQKGSPISESLTCY